MEPKEIISKITEFFKNKNKQFKELKIEKKIAILVGVIAVVLALIFGVKYINDSKYNLLFSGLSSDDAISITKELESQGVEMKVEGDSIYVPKEQVDKLRLELSGSLSNGSKGFELMDETSSFGLTDEEFNIKKQRMIQGEIEKSIKTFKQVEDARVNITQGEQSVFSDEGTPGSAAVTLTLKSGQTLEAAQVRSIMSLVSASSTNIPKQNVEVVDQNMNLLSEGLFDEEGNASGSNGIEIALKAEKELGQELEKSIISLLEPIFGQGKVKASVNADLNFDNSEITEVVINPETVVISETRSENTTSEEGSTGGAVDNNMNNTSDDDSNGTTSSKDESIEYDAGRTETKTIKAQGELNKITASVAIDGTLTATQIRDVNDMVANAIGMNEQRGDNVKVVSIEFNKNEEEIIEESETANTMKLLGFALLAVAIAGIVAFIIMSRIKKKKAQDEIEYDDIDEIELINKKIEQMESFSKTDNEDGEESITLEEEVRKYASENPERVTDLINSWLNV